MRVYASVTALHRQSEELYRMTQEQKVKRNQDAMIDGGSMNMGWVCWPGS